MQQKLIYVALAMTLILNGTVQSAEITGQVKFISKSAIYVSLGRVDGVNVADVGTVVRDGKVIGNLEVLFIADHSSSCKPSNMTKDAIVGDDVVFIVPDMLAGGDVDSTREISQAEETRTVTQLVQKTRNERVNNLSGMVGVQYYSQNDLGEFNYDFQQPSGQLRLNISNIQRSHFDLSIKLKARKTIRDHSLSEATSTKWTNRIYQLALQYNKPGSPFSYGVGRMQASNVSGLGYFDGVIFSMKPHLNYSFGLFGGAEPDWRNLNVNSEATKFGAYFNFQHAGANASRFNSTVALAGSYQKGEIDRESVFLRNTYSAGYSWSLYQSADLAINRGWRRESSGQTIELSSLILSARWNPVKFLSLSTGYDNRKTVRDFDNRSVADSLFDEAARVGFRAGVTARLPFNVRLNLGGNMRSKASGASASRSMNGGVNYFDREFSKIRANITSSVYTNLYSKGNRLSFSLGRNFFSLFDIMIETSRAEYTIIDVDRNIVNNAYKFDFNVPLSRSLYLSTYYEYEDGDDAHTQNMYLDLGYRF